MARHRYWIGAVAATALFVLPSTANAAVTCTLAGSTLDVDMSAATDFPQFAVGGGGEISLFGPGTSGCAGSPNTANTDLIEIDQLGADQDGQVVVNLSSTGFGPGATAEPTGISEIEFDIDLGTGSDSLTLHGAPEPHGDHIRFGTLAGGGTGANLNAPEAGGPDGDDLTLSSVESLSIFVGFVLPDADTIDGTGGPEAQFAGPLTGPVLNVAPGPGNDLVIGGDSGGVLDGNEGDDTIVSGPLAETLRGNSGNDTVSYARATSGVTVDMRIDAFQPTGGGGSDHLSLGPGDTDPFAFENLIGSGSGDDVTGTSVANTIEGRAGNDVIRGLAGSDTLRGEGDDDTLHANDNDADAVLDCGAGAADVLNRDPATLDPNGIVTGCEALNPPITSAPTLSGFDPASGSDSTTPRVRGTAAAGSTIDLFATANCSGTPVANDAPVAQLAGAGIAVTVPANSTRSYSARATTGAGGTSPCSTSIAYTHVPKPDPGPDPDPPPDPDPDPEDRDPPEGEIRKVKVKGDDVKVRFASDEPGSSFECRLDKRRFKPCTSPKRYRNLDEGRHKVAVKTTDVAGNQGERDKAKFEVK